MGFSSWRCALSNKSIPHDYNGIIHLILPNNDKVSGYYDGYGRVGDVSILEKVCETLELEGGPWANRGVECVKTGKKYLFQIDFNNYESVLDDFSLTVNECLRKNLVIDIKDNFQICMDNIKIITDHALKNPPNSVKFVIGERNLKDLKFESLPTSPNCEYQGYFYPEDFNDFPEDYLKQEIIYG